MMILVTRPKTKSLGFDCFGFRASLGLDQGLLTYQGSCTKALVRPLGGSQLKNFIRGKKNHMPIKHLFTSNN